MSDEPHFHFTFASTVESDSMEKSLMNVALRLLLLSRYHYRNMIDNFLNWMLWAWLTCGTNETLQLHMQTMIQ